jgi:hypothetical protein
MPNRGVHRAAHRGVRTIALSWRKAYVALPAVALTAVGIALVAPADEVKGVTVSKDSPAVVVPGAALTLAHVPPDPFTAGTQRAPQRESSKTGAANPTTKTAKTANQQPAPRSTSPTGQGPGSPQMHRRQQRLAHRSRARHRPYPRSRSLSSI